MSGLPLHPLIIGIDPGTGVTSPTAYCILDIDKREVHHVENVSSSRKELHHRIKDISDYLEATFLEVEKLNREVIVCIEYFVMRGKGGETLQRLVGSIMGRLPPKFKLAFAQNSTVKLQLAGHGHADKLAVAYGVLDFFAENKSAANLIKDLIKKKEMDILDSIAIGVTGWKLLSVKREAKPPRKKRAKSSLRSSISQIK